ncbi:hypothetical protein C0Q70_00764 [Pomacea canaliculata]|uniref:Secreted protein n=1 Tax=Pomacea canaliculata TaxID=400727 RepID=A0A2T7PXK1_POMCA|nr:hypothetical protein C0Q70_00764 [Pomacea canaliculata]
MFYLVLVMFSQVLTPSPRLAGRLLCYVTQCRSPGMCRQLVDMLLGLWAASQPGGPPCTTTTWRLLLSGPLVSTDEDAERPTFGFSPLAHSVVCLPRYLRVRAEMMTTTMEPTAPLDE